MILVYGIEIVGDEHVIRLLEECGFDIVRTKTTTVVGIITKDEENALVDKRLWDERLGFFQNKYKETLEGVNYFWIREEDIIC